MDRFETVTMASEEFDKVIESQLNATKGVLREFVKAQKNFRLKLLKVTQITKRANKAIDLGLAALRQAVCNEEEVLEIKEEIGEEKEEIKKFTKKSRKRRSVIFSSDEEDTRDFRSITPTEEPKIRSPEVTVRVVDNKLPVINLERISEREIKKWASTGRYKYAATISEKRRAVASQIDRKAGKFVKTKKSAEEEKRDAPVEEVKEDKGKEEIATEKEGPTIIEDLWLPVEERIDITKPTKILLMTEEGGVNIINNPHFQEPEQPVPEKEEEKIREKENKKATEIGDKIAEQENKENISPNHLMMSILDPKITEIEEDIANQLSKILEEKQHENTLEDLEFIPMTMDSPVEVENIWQAMENIEGPLDLSTKAEDVQEKENNSAQEKTKD